MKIINDISLLHPEFIGPAKRLHDYLIDSYETKRTKLRFEIFETFRGPERQARLLREGGSKAGPFESAHQLGLACDFVPYLTQAEAVALGTKPGWNWNEVPDESWDFLKKSALMFGVGVPILWDKVHVESPYWRMMRKVLPK